MARWVFLSLRWRGQIGVQSFLQLGTRIPYRSRARTSEGNGGVCSDCSDVRVAGAVHGYHGGKVAEQRSSVALVCSCAASDLPARIARHDALIVGAAEIRRGIPASLRARIRDAWCFRSPLAERGSSAGNLHHRLWCRCHSF